MAWSRSTRRRLFVQVHVVGEHQRAVHYSIPLHVRNVNIIYSFIILNVYEKRLENSRKVTFFNGKMTTLIVQICIVLGI